MSFVLAMGIWHFVRYWIPAVIWMSVIFTASTDLGSVKHSSRLIAPFLRWLNPEVTDKTIETVQVIVRKGGHFSEYALLSLLCWFALRRPQLRPATRRPWSWTLAGCAIAIAACYAATDELHQSFVPSRQASGWDVLLDTFGATMAMVALWALGRWRRWW